MTKEEIYNEIEQKMDELLGLCTENEIPFFSTFAIEKNGNTEYVSRVATPYAINVKLTNDKITQFNAALCNDMYLKIKTKPEEESIADLFGSFAEDEI